MESVTCLSSCSVVLRYLVSGAGAIHGEFPLRHKKAKEVTNWIPLYAQMGLGMSYKKAPKLYKNPVFLHPVYKGKNISAYVHYISTNTHVKSGSIYRLGIMFYYKSKDEDFARSYYLMDNSGAGGILRGLPPHH